MLVFLVAQPLDRACVASQAGKELNEADDALNATYQAVLSSIRDAKQKSLLIAAQKAWIKYRDDNVAFFAARYPNSKGGLFFDTHLIRERTAFLKSLQSTPPGEDPEGMKPSGYFD